LLTSIGKLKIIANDKPVIVFKTNIIGKYIVKEIKQIIKNFSK